MQNYIAGKEVSTASNAMSPLLMPSSQCQRLTLPSKSKCHATEFAQRTNDRLLVNIADDGIDLDSNGMHKANAFGLLGMKERTVALGRTLSMISDPGQRTMVVLSVPLQADTVGHR